MQQAHGGGQQRLQGHRAGRGLLERQAFAFFVLRRVHGTDHVDQAGRHGLDHGDAVILGAQGRLDLEEGAVVAHVQFVQRQVVDRDTCGDVQTLRLGAFQNRQGHRAGNLVRVVAHARHLNEGQIAFQPHAFRHR